MFKITTLDPNLDILTIPTYDMNGHPAIEAQISAPGMVGVNERMTSLEDKINSLEAERLQNEELVRNHPGLKDLHEKYIVMLRLVKNG